MTIDDDVAIKLERRKEEHDSTFNNVLNEVLRIGLDALEVQRSTEFVHTKRLDLGRALVDINNVAEALAIAEGDDYR